MSGKLSKSSKSSRGLKCPSCAAQVSIWTVTADGKCPSCAPPSPAERAEAACQLGAKIWAGRWIEAQIGEPYYYGRNKQGDKLFQKFQELVAAQDTDSIHEQAEAHSWDAEQVADALKKLIPIPKPE